MSLFPRAERVRASTRWVWLVPAAALAFVGCQDDRLPSEPESEGQLSASAQAVGVGADDWIVVFKDGTVDPPGLARRLVAANGGSIRFTYQHALKGFAGTLPPQAVEAIGKNPNVAYVERDGVVQTTVGSWGLDRIDQRDLPLDGGYFATYDGSGVDAYIIDTGIDFNYAEGTQFGSRLDEDHDKDFVDNDDNASDCHGHGTHVAGTVGSASYGVAPEVTIIGVRVLNCQGSGTWSGVIAGVDYVAQAAEASGKPSVANMSLGGGFSSSVNNAVNGAVAGGVTFAVSSGNSNADACGYSPASAADAITVNASTSSDARSSFSNYGTCTDIFAPGSSITSTTMGGGTASWSGTSMASPHVAGVAALLLDEDGSRTPAQVWTEMRYRATRYKIAGAGSGSPNFLLYSGSDSGDPCAGGGCLDVEVQWIGSVTVKTNRGNNGSGTVSVRVVDLADGRISGVTVNGSWEVNGNANFTSSSGVTDSNGMVTLSTGGIRFATSFSFCVTSLTGAVSDVTTYTSTSPCAPFEDGGTVDPPTDPSAGAPYDLGVTYEQKGKNWRAKLSWSGGAATVDVYRAGSQIAAGSNNNGSYTDNLGKNTTETYTYRVCNAGTENCSS